MSVKPLCEELYRIRIGYLTDYSEIWNISKRSSYNAKISYDQELTSDHISGTISLIKTTIYIHYLTPCLEADKCSSCISHSGTLETCRDHDRLGSIRITSTSTIRTIRSSITVITLRLICRCLSSRVFIQCSTTHTSSCCCTCQHHLVITVVILERC